MIMYPFSPTKWTASRTAAQAALYTSFRPKKVRFTYNPTVPVTTEGSVAFGTVFDGSRFGEAATYDEFARALVTTNGGFIVPVWQKHSVEIQLGRNLRANTFPTHDIDPDDIPFWFIIATSNPGNFGFIRVDCLLTLRNPITTVSAQPSAFQGRVAIQGQNFQPEGASGNYVPGQTFLFAAARRLLTAAGRLVPILAPFYAVVESASPLRFRTLSEIYDTDSWISLIGRSPENF